MAKLEKTPFPYTYDQLIDHFLSEWDWPMISYGGQDMVIGLRNNKKTKANEWYFTDPAEAATKRRPRPLTETYPTLEALLEAPVIDGKTIRDRFGELECFEDWAYVEQPDEQ